MPPRLPWVGPIILLLALSLPAGAAIIRVDPESQVSDGNGLSWPLACRTLGQAIEKAGDFAGPDEIWLADGVYVPEDDEGVISTFRIDESNFPVTILGGFQGLSRPGGGEEFDFQRDPSVWKSILSGDRADDDGDLSSPPTWSTYSDNCLHVVTVVVGDNPGLDLFVTLDGVTVSGGSAVPDSGDASVAGGGVFLSGAGDHDDFAAKLVGCVLVSNQAQTLGGAIGGLRTGVDCADCVFKWNRVIGVIPSSQTAGGGAIGVTGPMRLVRSTVVRQPT